MNKKSSINIALFTLITIAFTLGYTFNFWGIVDRDRFNNYDVFCQSQVIGRVIQAEKDGIFSKGGFTGWIYDDSIMKDKTWEEMTQLQFDLYRQETVSNSYNFIIYDGQVGGQAMTFAFLDKISPFRNSTNLKLFWILTSLSLALLLSYFVFWVYENYGIIASIITFLLLLASPWLTIFGRNLYWALSSFYLPFIILILLLCRESVKGSTITMGKLILISTCLVLAKLFFSGFELITTALVMFAVPLFYYWILRKWEIIFFLKRFLSIVVGALSAIILYTATFLYQLSTVKGSISSGIEHMIYTFLKRTSGNSADFPEAFRPSLEANIFEVLQLYFNSLAIDLSIVKVRFKGLFLLFLIFSVLSFLPKIILPSIHQNKSKYNALVFTTWLSILAPLSWYVIFKAHSYIHLGYNDIAWCMPFYLFGFALIGGVTFTLIKDGFAHLKKLFQVIQNSIGMKCN